MKITDKRTASSTKARNLQRGDVVELVTPGVFYIVTDVLPPGDQATGIVVVGLSSGCNNVLDGSHDVTKAEAELIIS